MRSSFRSFPYIPRLHVWELGRKHVGTLWSMESEVALHACLDLSWFYLFENRALARVASLRFHMHDPISSPANPAKSSGSTVSQPLDPWSRRKKATQRLFLAITPHFAQAGPSSVHINMSWIFTYGSELWVSRRAVSRTKRWRTSL